MSELVGIKFCPRPPDETPRLDVRDEHCRFVGRAREKAFYIRSENISCPLARFYLGIGQTKMEDLARTLVSWNDASDIKTGQSYLKASLHLERCSPYIIYFPYPTGNLKPDLLIMIGDAGEVQTLVQRYCAQTGERIKASLSGIGAACGECTAYPLLTGRANLSVGCNGSRPGIGLKSDELLFALPFASKMSEIII